MLAEYEGKIFRAIIKENKVNLWKYVPVDGFLEVTTDNGLTYYEKTIPLKDVKEFFNVKFLAYIDKKEFVIDSIYDGKVGIICGDRVYAELHGFNELERGIWFAYKNFDDFSKFKLVKTIKDNNKSEILDINKKQLIETWNKYVEEVSA